MTNISYKIKHHNGCGIQAIAKVTGKTPKHVRSLASCNFPNHREVVYLVRKLGFKAKTSFYSRVTPENKYIATVPSLNHKGLFHFIVIWANRTSKGFCGPVKVWDSSGGKKYVSQSKRELKKHEFRLLSWTSLIEVIEK